MTMVSRREFLARSTSFLAAAAVLPHTVFEVRRTTQPQRILIAGAGVAGLAAAYELQRAGHDVIVFEPRAIPGGRILTLRAPFADGLYAEAGAMYLPSHGHAVEYARVFGLQLAQLPFRAELGSLAHIAGQRIEQKPDQPIRWPVELKPEEAGESIRRLQRRYHYSRLSDIKGLNAEDWPHTSHLQYDDLSLAEFWRRHGASDGALRLMRLLYFDGYGDGIEHVSALQVLREYGAIIMGSKGAFQIRGGNDLLPRAFAERLAGKIHYGSRVVAVRHDNAAVTITVEDRSGRHQVSGDRLILTLPPPPLRSIEFTPPLPAQRQRAVREINPTPSTRVFMQFRERFWERDGNDGSASTDLPIQQVYHSTATQPGTRGILEVYAYGPRSQRLAAMSADDRLNLVLTETTKLHPRLLQYFEGSTSYSWDNDPWALGGHVYFKPGQIREFFPYIQQPEGRIHFAGDWIGGIPGYVQGALLSAHAVVKRIGAA